MNEKLEPLLALLRDVVEHWSPAGFATSLGIEDMLLLDVIDRYKLGIDVFTLDTGRLHQDTYDLLQRTRGRYHTPIAVFAPDAADIEAYVAENGPNGFYDSVPLRQRCCHIRKVKPLRRALDGKRAWITGLRREQAVTRQDLPLSEWDTDNNMKKFNPLAEWSTVEIWDYIRQHEVIHNDLHAKGYPSIGCEPCTRAIAPTEDLRAGRWWWENAASRECGLHPRDMSHA
ncbi:MAG: phosphoadenylyl-sulfate reductase [Alphaproteobacteria bacterium]|nr:phosphoadenylyl-sulfate reductase [Alphaproteobacteria bacterium]